MLCLKVAWPCGYRPAAAAVYWTDTSEACLHQDVSSYTCLPCFFLVHQAAPGQMLLLLYQTGKCACTNLTFFNYLCVPTVQPLPAACMRCNEMQVCGYLLLPAAL
jgi:hypothetical protein